MFSHFPYHGVHGFRKSIESQIVEGTCEIPEDCKLVNLQMCP